MRVEFSGTGEKLMPLLREKGIMIDAPCGGNGRCGKCRVRFISGAPASTAEDEEVFTKEDLLQGWRLACRAVVFGNTEIDIPDGEVLTFYKESSEDADTDLSKNNDVKEEYGIAIDIGSTTISGALVTLSSDSEDKRDISKRIDTVNHQKVYGADVISRISAANNGYASELRELVKADIKGIIDGLSTGTKIRKTCLAGNTTMLHLLMGDSCKGLGEAPYKPVRLSYGEMLLSDILSDYKDDKNNVECRIMPGISAFVGADIVSGMYELSFDEIPDGKIYMLLDLGTNGEMALADHEKISVCSTAAGPVFEGGGVSCGMAGVKGAIEHVMLSADPGQVKIKVIGDAEPTGICGSGVLELVSELRRMDIIDETGLLADEYFDDGFLLYKKEDEEIRFKQNDIRAVQLAKAAIFSGIEILLAEHGISAKDVDRVFLAGGFSEHLDTEKIKSLKLLPEEFLKPGVLQCVGNTSLAGCIKSLSDAEAERKIERILDISNEIPLAETDTFGESYIEAMNF